MFTRLARVLLALPLLVVVVQAAPEAPPTKLLRSPTVSATQIAFVYANNIWAVERAGAFCLVLEAIPARLAAEITQTVRIPTIGIGAGVNCDGQVLVIHDGEIVEQGRFQELLDQRGFFYHLYMSQFKGHAI